MQQTLTKIAYCHQFALLNIKLVAMIDQSIKSLQFFLKKTLIDNTIKPRNLCSLSYILNFEN